MRRVLSILAVVVACGSPPARDEPAPVDAFSPGRPPAVIVMIGDGMGAGQLDASSLYRHGATGRLFMQTLPRHAEVRTGGPSGITDSAASATVMATGHYTWNGVVALDRRGAPVQTSLERAKNRGWATGIVTTTSLPHATPAGFTAHHGWRGDYHAIAVQQARRTRPTVMLGGGTQFFTAPDVTSLGNLGYAVVHDRAALAAAVASGSPRLFGIFAGEHLTYVVDRPPASEPSLTEMSRAALDTLDRDDQGFFLMIEGGRIDHGGHENHLARSIGETLAFDDTVAMVTAWARGRGNVTLLVTSDHECGGLEIVTPRPAGEYPGVRWRWGAHTNARVPLFAEGPGTEPVGGVVDHRWIYEMARARIDGDAFVAPGREPIPDGEVGELRHRAVGQAVETGYGVGFNQLDALWLDATPYGLHVGIEGVFEWDNNAVEVLIDVDPGGGTGVPGLAGALTDTSGTADAVLAASSVTAPDLGAAGAGFGADFALVIVGGADPHIEELRDDAGLRGLRSPFGAPENLGWHGATINFGAVRTRGAPLTPVPGQGLEAFVAWSKLYPEGMPPGARLGLAAVLVNSDGGHTSNQALPPFPAGTPNPGRQLTPLPGVVLYDLDSNGDGTVDGATPPVVAP